MPTQSQSESSPYRNRGFSPLFRGPYSDQHLRVSDAERQAVTDRLAEHFGDGRLDQAEFDERVGRAMNAKTRADLVACSTTCRKQGLRHCPNGHAAGTGTRSSPSCCSCLSPWPPRTRWRRCSCPGCGSGPSR